MAGRMIIVPGAMPSRDANGRSLPALFRFYLPDTSIPATVWTDQALTVAHEFPIESDSAGRWPQIFADEADSFTVGWSDQVNDQAIKVFTGVSPAEDAALASVDLANAAAASALAAQAAAEAAAALAEVAAGFVSGSPLVAHSVSSVSIGLGMKTFSLTEDIGKVLLAAGQTVVAAYTTAPGNQMVGIVQAPVSPSNTLTINVLTDALPDGAGPYTAWTISLASSGGALSVAGLTGVITAAALKTALGIASTDITDFNTATDDRAAALAIALRR